MLNKWLLFGIGGLILMSVNKRSWSMPERGQPYQAAFLAAEKKYNLPHNLLARVSWQESRFRDDIINGDTQSSAGAVGIMQIVPRWHPDVDPFNPWDSIDYAGGYLKSLYKRFGDYPKALAAYNWGQGNLAKAITKYGDTEWLAHAPVSYTHLRAHED